MGGLGCVGDVDDVPGGVGRYLDPEEAGGAGTDRRGEGGGVAGVEVGDGDAAALGEAAEPGEAAVVHDGGAGDVVTGVSVSVRAVKADMPLAKARLAAAPSRSASTASAWATVGPPSRA